MAGGVTLHPSRRAVFDKKSQFFDCNRRTIHRLSKMSTALAVKPKIIAAEHIDVELAANQ
jgi:hypothetical protein